MGIFFNDPKPHVSKEELKKVRSLLYGKGWSHRDLDLIESFFATSINESKDSDKGIDALEITEGIRALKENENIYHLDDSKLSELETALNKFLS